MHYVKLKVFRKNTEQEVDIEADVYGDIVAVTKSTQNGNSFPLGDNEPGAARCLVLNKIYPKNGYDKKALNLLSIAKRFPDF